MSHENWNGESLGLTEEQETRAFDLLVLLASCGLSELEQEELDYLIPRSQQTQEVERLEIAMAASDLAIHSQQQEQTDNLPDSLKQKILIEASDFFSDLNASPNDSFGDDAQTMVNRPSKNQGSSWREKVAILVAAASLLLWLSGYSPFGNSSNNGSIVQSDRSAQQRLTDFLDGNPKDLIDLPWQPVHNKSAGGKVVWSDEKQAGFMVFSGMKANDPSVEQYQLWIFDTDPAQAAPVDGGVFDIDESQMNEDGEVVVSIAPHVKIDSAVQFAVTVERPGGVYVSKRENIPVLASLASNK